MVKDVLEEAALLHITPSERAALQLLAAGREAAECALAAGITEAHLDGLFVRMGVACAEEAVAVASRRGLLDPSCSVGAPRLANRDDR
jgi:hypothetical protein